MAITSERITTEIVVEIIITCRMFRPELSIHWNNKFHINNVRSCTTWMCHILDGNVWIKIKNFQSTYIFHREFCICLLLTSYTSIGKEVRGIVLHILWFNFKDKKNLKTNLWPCLQWKQVMPFHLKSLRIIAMNQYIVKVRNESILV
jgi:hypothetical protein